MDPERGVVPTPPLQWASSLEPGHLSPGGAEATLRSWSHDPFPRERRGCEAADRLATLLPWASDEKGRIGPPDRSTPAGLR